jgi:hypothetical protein
MGELRNIDPGEPRLRVFIPSLIAMLSMGSVAFYLRFLVALCQEWKPRRFRIHQPSRLRLEGESKIHRQPSTPRLSPAALQIAEIRLNANSNEFRRHRA